MLHVKKILAVLLKRNHNITSYINFHRSAVLLWSSVLANMDLPIQFPCAQASGILHSKLGNTRKCQIFGTNLSLLWPTKKWMFQLTNQ